MSKHRAWLEQVFIGNAITLIHYHLEVCTGYEITGDVKK